MCPGKDASNRLASCTVAMDAGALGGASLSRHLQWKLPRGPLLLLPYPSACRQCLASPGVGGGGGALPHCRHPPCARLSGPSHAPVAQLLAGSPETRAHCAPGAGRALGAGWRSLCKAFRRAWESPLVPPRPRPRGSSKLCVPGAPQRPPECLPGHDSWREGGGCVCGGEGRRRRPGQAVGQEEGCAW